MPNCSECGSPDEKLIRGLCRKHYNHYYNEMKKVSFCTVDGCEKNQRRGGMCHKHYNISKGIVIEKISANRAISEESEPINAIRKFDSCSVDGCEEKKLYDKKHRLCSKHYHSYRRKLKRELKKKEAYPKTNIKIDFKSIVST